MIAVAVPEPKPAARYPTDTRPPFEAGNTAAMRHGARSKRVLEPIVRQLTDDLVGMAPWSSRPAFAPEIASWAWAEARCVVLRAWIDEHGMLSAEVMQAAGELARAESRAATARDRLGLSPLALAKLLGAFTAAPTGTDDEALEQLRAEGRRIVDARAGQLGAHVPGLDAERAEDGSPGDESKGERPTTMTDDQIVATIQTEP